MDHYSFRSQLAFSIGFAFSRSRDLLRRILKEHTADDARQMLASGLLSTWNSRIRDRRRRSGHAEAPAPGWLG
jgi:hypothetical protein